QRLALSLAVASFERDLTDEETELVRAYDYGARATAWPEPTRGQARAQHVVARAVRSSYSRLNVLKENYPERWADVGPGWIHELDLPTKLTPWELHVLRGAAAHELRLLRADRRTQRKRLFKRWKVRKLLALLGTAYDALDAFTEDNSSLNAVSQEVPRVADLRRPPDAATAPGSPPPARRMNRRLPRSRRGGHGGSPATSLPPCDAIPAFAGVSQVLR
ncbi:MAG TPA: hypothetical protein VJS12_21970, partial [Steroidobacteraceae bacterium]|nr:hypothetical protein [Steroidobacteraceae bacterium]